MNVNDYFNDFPIDFFRLEPINFVEPSGFENGVLANAYLQRELTLKTKQTLSLSEDGYVRESLQQHLNLDQRNTSVVNCAVGQGKTSSLLRIIKSYSETNPEVSFVFAVPFVSLIAQYQRDLLELGVTEDQIFNYEKLGRSSEEGGLDYLDINRRFHIVTVNTLLGNPGESAPLQSEAKYNYIKTFSNLLETTNKEVIFIYDEIHDGIKNFSRIGEAHLWYFARTIRKNIVLSATYNVQSIEVIKMLMALTNNTLQILESERKICRAQSRLYLHFDNSYTSQNLSSITSTVRRLVTEGKNIDILSYSKNLCKKILENGSPLGIMLRDKFGEIRDCTSNLEANQIVDDDVTANRYDNNYCNVGTNFKSGVSIEKENHALIIILPPDSGGPYSANNGIFSDGVNSVIQAVARQRNAGEIHMFLRSPLWLNGDYLIGMSEQQKEILIREFEAVGRNPATVRTRNHITIPRVRYIPFSEHKALVQNKWSEQILRLFIPFAYNSNLELPALNDYILTESDKILTLEQFLGKNIASFVTYSAFTNQFYNARLAGYTIPFDPTDTRGGDDDISNLFEEKFNLLCEDISWQEASISEKYTRMRDLVISDMSRNLTGNHKSEIKFKVIEFLLRVDHNRFDEAAPLALKYLDLKYNSNSVQDHLSEKLRYFINKVINSKVQSDDTEFYYFKPYENINLFESEKEELWQMITALKNENPALKLNQMNFLRNCNQNNIGQKFYEYIVRSGFETQPFRPTVNGRRVNYKKILRSLIGRNM